MADNQSPKTDRVFLGRRLSARVHQALMCFPHAVVTFPPEKYGSPRYRQTSHSYVDDSGSRFTNNLQARCYVMRKSKAKFKPIGYCLFIYAFCKQMHATRHNFDICRLVYRVLKNQLKFGVCTTWYMVINLVQVCKLKDSREKWKKKRA